MVVLFTNNGKVYHQIFFSWNGNCSELIVITFCNTSYFIT